MREQTAQIASSTFRNNRGVSYIDPPRGGAVMNWDGTVTFETNTFEGNTASSGDAVFNIGVFIGAFVSDDDFESGGQLAPGGLASNGSFGAMTLGETVTQIPTDIFQTDLGTTIIEIGGRTPATEHDVVEFPGAMRIGGVLEMRVVGGFEPAVDDVFTIGSFGDLARPFDAIISPRLDGKRYLQVEYVRDHDETTAGTIRATVRSLACPGDIDGDGSTGFGDLTRLLERWGPCPLTLPVGCPGDVDLSGDVGPDDLRLLIAAWGPC